MHYDIQEIVHNLFKSIISLAKSSREDNLSPQKHQIDIKSASSS